MKKNIRVGEHFILGFHGYHVPKWLKEFDSRHGLGGVILFDYYVQTKKYENNIQSKEQLKDLCAAIHSLPSRPLICIDQEGGKVRRLKEGKGFSPYPSQWDFNRLELSEKKRLTQASFQELRDLGIDFNLAPVVDLALNKENTDIFTVNRSYSKDPREVRVNVAILKEIAREVGLGLCLKHFPGVGAAKSNSHHELLDLTEVRSQEQEDLFYDLVEGLPGRAMLISHGIVKDWGENSPISLSPKAIEKIRKKVNDVLLISDDLQMQGMQKAHTSKNASLLALQANMDFVIIGNNMLNEEQDSFSFAENLEKELGANSKFYEQLIQSKERISRRK